MLLEIESKILTLKGHVKSIRNIMGSQDPDLDLLIEEVKRKEQGISDNQELLNLWENLFNKALVILREVEKENDEI